MKNKKKNSDNISVFLESLESKKSERTTLKLTEKAIEGLAYLKDWHQLTVKELIDLMYASIGADEYGFDIEEIVKKMEAGDIPLEEALKSFEDGIKLIRFCQARLDEAQRRVELLLGKDDSLQLKPFSGDDGV